MEYDKDAHPGAREAAEQEAIVLRSLAELILHDSVHLFGTHLRMRN